MSHPAPDPTPNPDGSAGWEALPPDGEQPEDDAEDGPRTDEERDQPA